MRKPLLIAPFLLGLLFAPISEAASAYCPLGGRSLAELDDTTLFDARGGFVCHALRPEIAAQLYERLARGELKGIEGIAADRLRLEFEFDLLRGALRDRNWIEVERRIAAIDAQIVATASADELDPYIATLRSNGSRKLATIRSIVDGSAQPSATYVADPLPDWVLRFGFCGTPRMTFMYEAIEFPDSEDAWSAVGRDDLAIDHILRTQWVEAINLGTSPPRLKEFGERMLGGPGYTREVEAALAGIRIDATATGRVAAIPLLGHWLPLPVGMQGMDDDIASNFDTPEQLANWLRPMLHAR